MVRFGRLAIALSLLVVMGGFQNCSEIATGRKKKGTAATRNSNPVTTCQNTFCISWYDDVNFTNLAYEEMQSAPIDYDFGGGGPDPNMEPDTFSGYLLGNFDFAAGTYEFSVTADDGVRVIVDGETIIDRFFDQGPTTYTANKVLGAGVHQVEIYYYENGGGAVLRASWRQL